MIAATESYSWYVVQVKARQEMQVASALNQKGYEAFVPAYKVKRKWSDRTKEIELPLFPAYTFCRFDRQLKCPVVATPGVIRIVGFGSGPAPVSASEIQSLKILSRSGMECAPHSFVQAGQRVEVVGGPLAGVEGIVISAGRRNRLVISVEVVHASAVVEVDEAAVMLKTVN